NAASGFPSLLSLGTKRTRQYVNNVITHGKGMMPAYPKFTQKQKQALLAYLYGEEKAATGNTKTVTSAANAGGKTTYKISGYTKFTDKNGYPAVRPPWGTLNAIDLNNGEYLWSVPFGEYPELSAKGIAQTGAESYGGPV